MNLMLHIGVVGIAQIFTSTPHILTNTAGCRHEPVFLKKIDFIH